MGVCLCKVAEQESQCHLKRSGVQKSAGASRLLEIYEKAFYCFQTAQLVAISNEA
jgi:hypothetical protein